MGTRDMWFIHILKVDTIYLRNRPDLYLVDTATHFSQRSSFDYNQFAAYVVRYSLSGSWYILAHPTIYQLIKEEDHLKRDEGKV